MSDAIFIAKAAGRLSVPDTDSRLDLLPKAQAAKPEFRKLFLDLALETIFLPFTALPATAWKHPQTVVSASHQEYVTTFRCHELRDFVIAGRGSTNDLPTSRTIR